MVKNGYINGFDGRINPKGNITRAEFSQLISNIIASFADIEKSEEKVINGNTIIRNSDSVFENKTINGDLIIADGAGSVSLKNITVKGRILIRGGSSCVNINSCKAEKVIITNPNGSTIVDLNNNDFGSFNIKSNVKISGNLKSAVVLKAVDVDLNENAEITDITVNSKGAAIHGKGKVTNATINFDGVRYEIERSNIAYGKNVLDKTQAEGFIGRSSGRYLEDASTDSSKGSSQINKVEDIINIEKCGIVNIENISYGVINFKNAEKANEYSYRLSGNDITYNKVDDYTIKLMLPKDSEKRTLAAYENNKMIFVIELDEFGKCKLTDKEIVKDVPKENYHPAIVIFNGIEMSLETYLSRTEKDFEILNNKNEKIDKLNEVDAVSSATKNTSSFIRRC